MKNSPCFLFSLFVLMSTEINSRDRVIVPFQLHDQHLVVVEGEIGDLASLNLVIDTGATKTVLSPKIAKRLGLKGQRKEVIVYGRAKRVREVLIPSLRLGGLVFEDVPAQVDRLLTSGTNRCLRVDALIGLEVLRRTSLMIDYESRNILFGPVVHSGPVLSFYGKLPFIPVYVKLGSRRLCLLLDTGAGHLILFGRATEGRMSLKSTGDEIGIVCLGRKVWLKGVRLEKFMIGEHEFDRATAYVLSERIQKGGVDGVLGVASLGLKRLNLDLQSNQLSLAM